MLEQIIKATEDSTDLGALRAHELASQALLEFDPHSALAEALMDVPSHVVPAKTREKDDMRQLLHDTLELLNDVVHGPEQAWYRWLGNRDSIRHRIKEILK